MDYIKQINKEPYVYIENAKNLLHWDNNKKIIYNQRNRQTLKFFFYRQIFDYIETNNIKGHYFEFGCHKARTFRMALTEARKHLIEDMLFFAFDSFEGLPPTPKYIKVKNWKKGALYTSEKTFMNLIRKHGLYIEKVKLIKGFYNQSLTSKLQKDFLKNNWKIALVTIDCDLYSSAKPVFSFIDPLLQKGSILYIDDFFVGGDIDIAFYEYRKKSKWSFVEHMQIGWWGKSYIVK